MSKPLLVLAFDAMDFELARRWASWGELPALGELLRESASIELHHDPEYSSGTIWTSLNTGARPHEHDLFYLPRLDPGTYRVRWGQPGDLRVAPFWRKLAAAGKRIVLADVPFAEPDPRDGGLQLVWCRHDMIGKGRSVPDDLLHRLTSRFGRHPVPFCFDYRPDPKSLARLRQGLVTGLKRRTALLCSTLREASWDLFYAGFSEAHCAGHLMWQEGDLARGSNTAPAADRAHCPGIREIYRAIDTSVGEVVAAAGEGVTIAVIMSHGIGPNYHADHLFPDLVRRFNDRWEGRTPRGTDRDLKHRGRFDSAWRATVAKLPIDFRLQLRRHVPMALRDKIALARAQLDRGWRTQCAFPLPLSDGFSALRVNLIDREGAGRIRPGSEYRRYLDTFEAELWGLTRNDSRQPAVARIFRADRRVEPSELGASPDLLIWWDKSEAFVQLASPRLGRIDGDWTDLRTGEHLMRGLFAVKDADHRPGLREAPQASVLDIAPTLSALTGLAGDNLFARDNPGPRD